MMMIFDYKNISFEKGNYNQLELKLVKLYRRFPMSNVFITLNDPLYLYKKNNIYHLNKKNLIFNINYNTFYILTFNKIIFIIKYMLFIIVLKQIYIYRFINNNKFINIIYLINNYKSITNTFVIKFFNIKVKK
jgi:hypothetical protein